MPCVDNKDLIYNVKELPETFSITSGDLLLIETDEGTNIMDYDNLVIGLDNTTFGTTITEHSTDIAVLSAGLTSLNTLSATVDASNAAIRSELAGSTTKAMITLSAADEFGPVLIAGSNIASVEFEAPVVRFNFSVNFANTNYMVLPSAPVAFGGANEELNQFVISERQTNYLDLSVIDMTDNSFATAVTGTPIGFQIQTF